MPGWRSRLSVQLQPGHDLAVREFESRVGLWADGSEPGACFRFCVSLSLCPSPIHALSLSVPKIDKNVEKKLKKKKKGSSKLSAARMDLDPGLSLFLVHGFLQAAM